MTNKLILQIRGSAELISRDAASAQTLLRYLDTGSDVGRVAAELAVHPTTVRYRLRRTAAALGIDLADPADRLAIQLQLCRGLRSRPISGMIYLYGGKGAERHDR